MILLLCVQLCALSFHVYNNNFPSPNTFKIVLTNKNNLKRQVLLILSSFSSFFFFFFEKLLIQEKVLCEVQVFKIKFKEVGFVPNLTKP